jgi:hypothetical protein
VIWKTRNLEAHDFLPKILLATKYATFGLQQYWGIQMGAE